METCAGPECKRPAIKKGFCGAHYQQNQKHGYTWVLGTKPHRGRKKCIFDGCGRLNHAYGLCAAHAKQKRMGVPLRPVLDPRPEAADGYAWCCTCKQYQPTDRFAWDKSRDEPQRQCNDCRAAYMRAYSARPASKSRAKVWRLARHYGISSTQYADLYAAQDGLCRICGQPIPNLLQDKGAHTGRHAVDHCHSTGKVRGLLCGGCNAAIGHLRDDPALCEAAARYLQAHQP